MPTGGSTRSHTGGTGRCRRNLSALRYCALAALLAAAPFDPAHGAAPATPGPKAKPDIFEATLRTTGQTTPELSTDEFKAFLAARSGVVLDARPRMEFELAHIPGSISIEETGLLRIAQDLPTPATAVVIYANGPFSGQASRRAEQLLSMGFTNVSRYQLGLAVWRALGNTAQTTLDGVRRLFHENTALFVDARSRDEYSAGTIPGAESVPAGDASGARKEHRLQYYDHAMRIVVFGNTAQDARTVAEELARNAYPNSSFFNGTYQELQRAKFFFERKPSFSNLDGVAR